MNTSDSRRRRGLGTIARGAVLPLRFIRAAWWRASVRAEFEEMPDHMRDDIGITLADVVAMSTMRRRR